MGNDKLKSMLQASKEADKIVKEGATRKPSNKNSLGGRITAQNYDTKMAELDNLVFGPYDKSLNEGNESSYSAEEEMKRINERQNRNVEINSKLPKNILEEIINNPCNFSTDIVMQDPRMSQLEEKIKQSNKQITSGIDKVLKINSTLETLDESKKPSTQSNDVSVSGGVDYSLIKTIIESVVEEKLAKYSQSLLTESKTTANRRMSTMMLGDSFRFIDNEGNVYECGDLKYKGKARMKNKK